MTRILITLGDPAGIGPEVVQRALSSFKDPRHVCFRVIGDAALPSIRPGRVQAEAGRAAYAWLREAVDLLKRGEADALVTGPVSKEAIVRAGIPWRGHTEFLAESFRRRTTMMFVTGRFRVSLVTTHWPIRAVPARLTQAEVLRVLRATAKTLTSQFGIRRPRIGLAALNPHAGEGGLFGEEERRVLIPAARTFRVEMKTGARVEGPLASDSLLEAAARGAYDAVVALYHDQALIPLKLIGWDRAVNLTLGLPFIRTSPVHGTAFDVAGKGKARASSMRAALDLAIELTRR